METTFTPTDTGFLVVADGITYVMEWVDGMLKVMGPDVCYFIVETARGIEQVNCTLTTFTLLMSNF